MRQCHPKVLVLLFLLSFVVGPAAGADTGLAKAEDGPPAVPTGSSAA